MNLDLALGHEWEDPNEKKKKGITASGNDKKDKPDPAEVLFDPLAPPQPEVEEKEWTVEELMAPINYLSESRFGGLKLPRKARTPTPGPQDAARNEGPLDLPQGGLPDPSRYRTETPVNAMHPPMMTLQPLSPQQRRKMKKAERDAHDKALAKERVALKKATDEAIAAYATLETKAEERLATSMARFNSPPPGSSAPG